jgi:molybdopterin converting factor small subunit
MKIIFKSIGLLEEVIKAQEFSFPEKGIRLGQFFQYLSERYGPIVKEHLLPGGAFSSHYAILVNGKNIKLLGEMETELKDGDRVVVLTFVPGG